jgi:hypothetical protein
MGYQRNLRSVIPDRCDVSAIASIAHTYNSGLLEKMKAILKTLESTVDSPEVSRLEQEYVTLSKMLVY